MSLAKWTDKQIIDQLDTGYHWSGQVITYDFPLISSNMSGAEEVSGFGPLSTNQQIIAQLALKLWDDLIKPDISKTNINSNIEFGFTSNGAEYASTYFPQIGSIWFNSSQSSLTSPIIGQHGFISYIHEIGHAFGLNHMGDYNGSGNWIASSYQDSTVYTVMSYFGPDWSKGQSQVAWADWIGADGQLYAPQTPGLYDILAIQSIYGAKTTTRLDNTVYGFNSNITGVEESIYNFTINKNPIITLFDSGGTDVLDLSGWITDSQIDLTPGSFSSCNSMTNNIAIDFSTIIENAYGGKGSDSIKGNSSNNILSGRGGNDNIDGGDGVDTVVFVGNLNEYVELYDKSTNSFKISDTIKNRDGTDIVSSVEYFQFSDGKISSVNFIQKDLIAGTIADDIFVATSGSQAYDGLAGNDYLRLSGVRSEYQVTLNDGAIQIADLVNSRDGIDTAVNVEKLVFKDGSILLDFPTNPQNDLVYRLYQAGLARTPEELGFRAWVKAHEAGLSFHDMAKLFINSDEFLKKYGPNLSSSDFVTQLYNNVLGRGPEFGATDAWVNVLNNGSYDRPDVLLKFASSDENIQITNPNIDNGYWLV